MLSYILLSILGIINLIFYEFNPEMYVNSTNLLSFVIIPIIVIIVGINLLPKFLFKGKKHTNENSEETEQVQFSENSIPAVNDAGDSLNPEIAALIANSDKPDTVNDAGDGLNPEIAALIANSDKPDTVNNEYEDQSEDPIDLESDSISEHVKNELSEFRKEIKEIKNKLDVTQKSTELFDSYKETMFELKAFKTEIQNPLKFIENMTQDYNLKNSPFLKSKDDEKPEKHHELMENIFKESVSPIISEASFSKYNEESTNTNENDDSISPPNKSLTNLDNLDEKDDTWQQ